MCNTKTISMYAAVAFGVVSAGFWLASAFAKKRPSQLPAEDGFSGGYIADSDGNDVVATLKKQSRWNTWAAIFAALAAVSQAVYTYLS